MIEKAKLLADKFDDLTDQLSDPEVLNDHSALERISRERSRLEPLARTTREIMRLEAALADVQASFDDPELGELAREEASEIEPQIQAANTQLLELLVPRDTDADRNVIVEIRQGSGGEEAALWAADLYRM